MNININKTLFIVFVIIMSATRSFSQISGEANRYVRIGELQSHFSAYGSERAWNGDYYEGLRWPAKYSRTDNAVIKRSWVAVEDFTNEEGEHYNRWATYLVQGNVKNTIYPMELKQTSKFPLPTVIVDGDNITAPYAGDIDEVDPQQVPDRIIKNVVNLSNGLQMTRKIYAFSQQYHDNYFIKEITFKNTGNVDADPEIELQDSIKGLRFGWGTRYSVSREGASNTDFQQSYGKHSWVTRRGEEYSEHVDEVRNFDASTESLEKLGWLRAGFSWMGQSENNDYDNIGAPDLEGKGRLSAPQFAGSALIHADKGPNNKEGDPEQPVWLGWQAGDTYPEIGENNKEGMNKTYNFLKGNPHPSESYGGDGRMYEENTSSITDRKDPYTIHGDEGGTNVMFTYGPYDLAHGDSITIVEVEGVNGLSRQKCEKIGKQWLDARENPDKDYSFELPPKGYFSNEVDYGGTTDNKDVYKNSWVYTGMDSILTTFKRATKNYQMDYEIPRAPKPPQLFEVESGGDKIMLTWEKSKSESNSNFAGYRIYRAVGTSDTVFSKIAELPPGTKSYEDVSAKRGFAYYYYLVAYTDGSQNTSGEANPTGELESGKYYTMTNKPAYLKRKAGKGLENIRIVPNPYNISARDLQYTGEENKLMFLNIPAYCKIKIFTERGDLIKTIEHDDGSGDETWRLVTKSRQTVASGVYLAHFKVTQDYKDPESNEILYKKGESIIKKFIIVR